MKKLILLFLLCSCSLVNAQKYIFNTLTKYSSIYNKVKGERICYTNSNDDSFFLRLIKLDLSFSAILYDYKNLKKHEFKVVESNKNGGTFFKFDFLGTSDINYFNKNNYKNYAFTFQTVNFNDTIKNVKLNVYKNSKKKKSLMEYDLVIKTHESNHFPAFRINSMHPYEFLEKLNIFENGIIVSAKGNTLSGQLIEYKLEDLLKVNFELNISKKQK